MGFLSQFFNASASRGWTTWVSPIKSASGELITTDNALNLSAVYACINIKANALAKLPLQVFQKTSDGNKRVRDHRISYLLENRPNPYMSPFVFKHTVQVQRNAYGVCYVHIPADRRGEIQGLYILPAQHVTVAEDASGNHFYIYQKGTEEPVVYSEDEVIRLPYLTTDGFTPRSPIAVARETIGTLKKQQKFIGSFYQNGTLSRGILKIPSQLSKDNKDKVREAWMEANSGEDNASKIAVLDGGMEFQNMTIPLADAEFIASQKFGVEEIARIFNVPLHLVNSLERATFSNIEQQSMDFIQNSVMPDAIAWEEEANYKLFTESEQKAGYYVKYNLTSAMRGDSQSRATFYKTMLEMGAFNINEVRELEEKDAIENGDKHFVSLNHTTLDYIEEYQKQKK